MANYYTVYVKPSCLWTDETLIDKRIDAHFYSIKYMQYYNKLMKCKIKKMSLYNICSRMNSGPFGSALLASQYVDKGVAFIRPLNCKDYIVDIDNDVVFISKEDSERLKSSKFSSGDLIFTKIGNGIGDVAIIPQKIFECNISGNLMGVKVKNNIDNYYVLTFLKSIYGQNQIWQGMMNSAKPKIDMDTLKSIVIPIPSPEIQKYIGDKVRKAEEFREEAKRLKKEAEEILINEIGFNNVNKGNLKYHWIKEDIVDDRIDSDFYDLKYQVLIEIEKKYNCYLMEDIIIDKYTGKTPGKEYDDIKGIPLIVVKNVEENILNLDNNDRRIKDNNSFKKTEENDLLITRVGSVGVVSIVEENEKGLFLSDNVICLKLKEGLFNRYIAFYLNSIYGKLMVERWTKGAVQGVINYESINKFKIPIMDNNIMKEIDLKILKWKQLLAISKQLIQEAKQDVEDLIEGNFDMSKVKANS
ncbi:restriction modification system DNA specificity domain protein [Desulfotomaculum nigrificans CO-1-SRB]|uniref:Restriction modification system DNA specificity domain protein n=1 Tax=Desulfotomaculum nigrificans (strain DSM 14880 / VKM B-2319 / CO-1-SRB) TaxID=868595 RepID=F6B6B8_DESCC|nr:restriction endonuclease subunit S [Desulfotomaculum nigrificans]AEF93189.1 restriction modification system DNA specificity domain protein [Desulfotomaculum nigrificans CO-1-SRB]